ncbi:cathepsin L [Sarracenia purpurea var. burkii]
MDYSITLFLTWVYVFGVLQLLFLPSQLASSSRLLLADAEESMQERHRQWMARHGRVYKDADEKDARFQIFKDNVGRIDAFNNAGGVDRGDNYSLGVNRFADLTNDEFRASHNGFKRKSIKSASKLGTSFRYSNVTAVPATMDWRNKGAVTPVKDQGQCGKHTKV